MSEIEEVLRQFKSEANEVLFEDLHFDSRLKERVRQGLHPAAVRPGLKSSGIRPALNASRVGWKGWFFGTVAAAVVTGLVIMATPAFRGSPGNMAKESALSSQAAGSPGGAKPAEPRSAAPLRDATAQPSTEKSPAPSQGVRGLANAGDTEEGLNRKVELPGQVPGTAALQSDRAYPGPDAVPARITYRLETALPAAPSQARSFKVDRSRLGEDDVKALALRFGFSNPQLKRVNETSWIVGQDENGQSITETWPANKGQPGTWLNVFDTRHLFWDSRPGPAPPKTRPTVAWLEEAARAWLKEYGLDAGGTVQWKGELNPRSLEPGRYPMLLWSPTLDGLPVQTTGAQFSVAGDGTVVYASFPLWRVEALKAAPLKPPDDAFQELKAREIRLDKRQEHTVTITKVELIYGDPSAYWPGDVELFYHFQGLDDNGVDFNQYVYARKDKTGRAPWERP